MTSISKLEAPYRNIVLMKVGIQENFSLVPDVVYRVPVQGVAEHSLRCKAENRATNVLLDKAKKGNGNWKWNKDFVRGTLYNCRWWLVYSGDCDVKRRIASSRSVALSHL
ncbi:hypothetical protein Tco_0841545 [Tanacetum coccineum]|uniref:Uncharacterized protein n=1 Tax=Tanacetum coccineum TaxID=301880 RepID=A0ABQ5B0K0_9ASTR